MLYQSLTIHTPDIADPDRTQIEQQELARRTADAAYRLSARARADKSNEDEKKLSYGQVWLTYMQATGFYPEM